MNLNSVSIEEELRKNAALKKSDIEELKKWCAGKHYPASASDSDLALFLHSSYYYLETAKSNVESYYAARESLPQFFEDRSTHSEALKKIFDAIAIVPLAKRTREGYRVILVRGLKVERKDVKCADAIKVLNMVLELDVHEQGTQQGYVFAVDVHGSNAFDPRSFDAAAVRRYFEYLRRSAPVRWFGLHFVNTLLPFEQREPFTRMTIVQNDYVDATYLHADLGSLNEVVPTDALPDEMGGRAGPLKDLQAAQVAKLRDCAVGFALTDVKDAISRCFREIGCAPAECSTLSSQDPSGDALLAV